MNEFNIITFLIVLQEKVNKYKSMITKDYDYQIEINQHQEIIDALEKQISQSPMYFDGLCGGLECPNCKTNVSETQIYCNVCGQKLKNENNKQ